MKLFKSTVMLTAALVLGFLPGCSDDDGIDNRDLDYGYVQFKLYKEASYVAPSDDATQQQMQTRAAKPQLNYLAEASKVRVTLSYGEQTIVQTLTLSSADSENAEYGIRSGKLKLLTGNYEIVRFTLFDNNDDELYNGNATDPNLTVIPGGLTVHDLTVNVVPRGKVRFTLTKDMSGFTPPTSSTRANISREYIFEEIGKFDVSVKNTETNNIVEFEQLPATFSIHFDDPENTETPEGYQTSTCACDSLLSLQAGNYIVIEYRTYDSDGILLETNDTPVESPFTVEDNRTTDADVAVTLYEADEYMKDHYALYAIWKALHGPEWSYDGENYPIGSNWNFDKDPDLWSYQPGVEVHTNGRIAKIDISGFGFYGPMPKELGQLTELVELYLGTHNDTNMGFKDPTLDPDQSLTERSRNRMKTTANCYTPCTRPRRCPGPAPLPCASTAYTPAPRSSTTRAIPRMRSSRPRRDASSRSVRWTPRTANSATASSRCPQRSATSRNSNTSTSPTARSRRCPAMRAKARRVCRDSNRAPISNSTTARR